jgi:CBS domain-containing protein
MTPEVVTVGEQTSFKEIAATMAEHRVNALPVLDEDGRVAGIVSEADLLLKVFLRSDAEIAQEIRQKVLLRAMSVHPDSLTVQVRDGFVTLTGQLERRGLIPIAVSLVHGIDGVADVVDRLTFELDASPIMVPSDLLISRAPGVRRRI